MKRKDEDDMENGFIGRIVGGVIVFAILALIVKFSVETILSVKVPLIIIAIICGIVVFGVSAYKWWRDHNDY